MATRRRARRRASDLAHLALKKSCLLGHHFKQFKEFLCLTIYLGQQALGIRPLLFFSLLWN